jgi:acetyl esterase/lipase
MLLYEFLFTRMIVDTCANTIQMELRLGPQEKPKPEGFPKTDPLAFLIPLFDAYASPARKENIENPRLSPILASVGTLPKDVLMIVPMMDILLHEQLTFLKRVQDEARPGQQIEAKLFKDQLHGWSECELALSPPLKPR